MKNDVFSLLCHQEYLTHRLWLPDNLAAFVDIDALALGTAVCNHAVQTNIGAVVVILTRYTDNAGFQVEVEPVEMLYAVDNIVIRSILFQLVYEIRRHSVIATLGDVERQLRRQLIIAAASLLGQGCQVADGLLP